MEKIKYYDAIFKRKSIRKFDLAPLDSKDFSDLVEFIKDVKPMFSEIKIETRIVGHKEIKNIVPIVAPHYLLLFSKSTGAYLTNAGFMLQQVDLYLSANGIGCCYLGLANPSKEIKADFECEGFEYVIMLGFGKPKEPVHRANTNEFKRRSLADIFEGEISNQLMEVARLSPSASNRQPWFFTGTNEVIHAYCSKQNIIKALLYERMNKIDMGIALCHIDIAAEHEGLKISFTLDEDAKTKAPKGHYYIATALIQ